MNVADARNTIMESLRASGHMRPVYTVDQVAKALGQSRTITYDMVNQGKIPSSEIGGRRKVTITMLIEYLVERDQTARRAS